VFKNRMLLFGYGVHDAVEVRRVGKHEKIVHNESREVAPSPPWTIKPPEVQSWY
jgi:hypothetical protein